MVTADLMRNFGDKKNVLFSFQILAHSITSSRIIASLLFLKSSGVKPFGLTALCRIKVRVTISSFSSVGESVEQAKMRVVSS